MVKFEPYRRNHIKCKNSGDLVKHKREKKGGYINGVEI